MGSCMVDSVVRDKRTKYRRSWKFFTNKKVCIKCRPMQTQNVAQQFAMAGDHVELTTLTLYDVHNWKNIPGLR